MVSEAYINSEYGLQSVLNSAIRVPGINVKRLSNGGLTMSVLVQGTVKGSTTALDLALDPSGQPIITPGAAAYEEVGRMGQLYSVMATAAVAALVVRPGTTAALEIFNNTQTQTMVVDRLFTHNLVGVANSAFGIYAMVTLPKAAPTDAALVIASQVGKAPQNKTVLTAASTSVSDNGWFPYGPGGNVVTITQPGVTLEANVLGRLLVPPLCSLCLHVVGSTTGVTCTSGASWYWKTFSAPSNPLL